MQTTAQGWLVLGLTNSAGLLGLTSAAANVPILLFSLYAGVLADRVDQRRLLVVTQIIAAIVTAGLAVVVSLGIVEIWHVLLVAFLLGCVSAMASPAYQALVSTLVDGPHLGNAIALNSAQFNVSRIFGPTLAGVGIALGGLALAFWANSLSFVVVVVVLVTLPIQNVRTIGRIESSMWSNLMDGLRYARNDRVVLTLLMLTIGPGLFNLNYLVLMPIYARDILQIGAPGLGLLTAGVGVEVRLDRGADDRDRCTTGRRRRPARVRGPRVGDDRAVHLLGVDLAAAVAHWASRSWADRRRSTTRRRTRCSSCWRPRVSVAGSCRSTSSPRPGVVPLGNLLGGVAARPIRERRSR